VSYFAVPKGWNDKVRCPVLRQIRIELNILIRPNAAMM